MKGLLQFKNLNKTKNKKNKIVENTIFKFNDYSMDDEDNYPEDLLTYLNKLHNPDVNGWVNDLLTTHHKNEKEECIEDILLELGDIISEEKYKWVSSELKKYLK